MSVHSLLLSAGVALATLAPLMSVRGEDFTFISPAGEWDGKKLNKDEIASAFSKSIANRKDVAKAEMLVTALGSFEFYVNGSLVSVSSDGNRADFLRPGATDFDKRRFFLAYDVTSQWKRGADDTNSVSAFVARSWFSDMLGGRPDVKPAFGAKIRLTYSDGSVEELGTDSSWSASFRTPFLRAGIYYGEVRDGRIESDAAVCAGDSPAETNLCFTGVVTPAEGPGVSVRWDLALSPVEAYVYRGIKDAASVAYGRVAVERRWDCRSDILLHVGDTLVIDFGQNAAAVPEIIASAVEGTVLTFKGAEMLNDSNGEQSRGNDGPGGSIYRANYRSIKDDGALVRYVFAGRDMERYMPTFTFMGYRYAEIAATAPVTLRSVRSVPVTSIAKHMERGNVTTGNARVNRLIENVRWGMYSNYLSLPTDCPQRDERMGWTADTQVFVAAAFRVADVYSFLSKYMTDMCDDQDRLGRFPATAPRQRWGGFGYGRLGWADAGVFVPWMAWRMSGERSIIDANWSAMCRYLAHQQKTKNKTHEATGGLYQWADWLSYEKYESRSERGWNGKKLLPETLTYWDYLAGCHWLWNARKMSDMAQASGRKDGHLHFERMADEARAYLKSEFFRAGGRLPTFLRDMQTPHLFALRLGLYDDQDVRREAIDQLVGSIESHGGCLQTGFLGTAIIMDSITYDAGRPDIAYTLLLQDKNPSWLYSVDQGATTIWERWDSYTKEKGFGPASMNSFNHYAYGSVLDWICGTAAGIQPGPNGGFDSRFTLAPIPDERLGSISAEFPTRNGRIVSSWRYQAGKCLWHFEVPQGSVATVTFGGKTSEYATGSYDLSL